MPVMGWLAPINGYGGKSCVLVGLALAVTAGGCASGADHERKTRGVKTVTVHIDGFKKSESGAT
jgi:hypothetical protein